MLVVGDVIDDILVRPKGMIRPDTDVDSKIEISAGGSAANFACWLATQGVKVDFVGRVGLQDVSRHEEILRDFGVTPHLQADSQDATGKIVVLVEGEHRTFLTDRGANRNLDVDSIPSDLFRDLVYVSGYSLLSLPGASVTRLVERAHEQGALVACDPGSYGFIEDFGVGRFLSALEGVDILLPNLEEGRVLSGEDRPELICRFLAERFRVVALTMGSQGCAAIAENEYLESPAIAAEVIDPTGAGDAFSSAFLASYLESKNLKEAMGSGVKAGAKAVTVSGGRPKRS